MISIIPMPPTPQVSQQIMTGIKIGIAVFYGVLALMGAFWLYYFNTARVRTQFGPGAAIDGPGGRPLSVSVIAWLMLAGGAICIGGAFSPFPGMMFGLIFTGWSARAFYVGFAAIEIWLGVGLLRLNPLSRVLAIAMFGFGILNSALFAVLPGHSERLRMALDSMPFTMQQPMRIPTLHYGQQRKGEAGEGYPDPAPDLRGGPSCCRHRPGPTPNLPTAAGRRSSPLRRCCPCPCTSPPEDTGTADACGPPCRRCCATR